MEKNQADERLLSRIETQAQWDSYVSDFVKDFGDIFIKHNITLDAGIICWQLNMLKNRIIDVENKLDEVIEVLRES